MKNNKSIQQQIKLRAISKQTRAFTDRKKEASKKACRGKIKA